MPVDNESAKAVAEPSAAEKRRYQRYPNCSARVEVARQGLGAIFRANPHAECLNFSRTGLQFDCDKELAEGEKLLIDIMIDDLHVDELKAVVVSRKPQDKIGETGKSGWCYGARFCLEDPTMDKDRVYHDLLVIENTLKCRQQFD